MKDRVAERGYPDTLRFIRACHGGGAPWIDGTGSPEPLRPKGCGLGLPRGLPGGEQVIRREHDGVAGGGAGTGYGQQRGAVVGTEITTVTSLGWWVLALLWPGKGCPDPGVTRITLIEGTPHETSVARRGRTLHRLRRPAPGWVLAAALAGLRGLG